MINIHSTGAGLVFYDQSSTINLPRIMLTPQLNVNVPANCGVNPICVVRHAARVRLMPKSPETIC